VTGVQTCALPISIAVTPILEFPGPILSLHNDEESDPIAIVFNLATGNYEAHRVKVACAN